MDLENTLFLSDNCQIILIETFPYDSKDELTSREAFYIKSYDVEDSGAT
jgi:hypothetical protein